MNKATLIERIAEYDNFDSKKQAGEFLADLLGIIKDEVVSGNEVTIAGFGKFERYTKQDGSFKPKFTAFKDFKDAVTA